MKRISIIAAVVLVLASALSAQSLVELAKREKARRESFHGRHATVIRAADLMKVQKVSGVQVIPPEPESGDLGLAETQDAGLAAGTGEEDYTVQPSGSGAPARRLTPAVAPNGPLITSEADRDQAGAGATLEAQLKAASDLVDLLNTKMAALRQQYEAQDAMVPGYVIQQQMEETNQRLLKAQAQQARIEAMAGKAGTARKAPGEPER
jgi:hypothetical protein